MVKKKTKKMISWLLLLGGLFIVFATHIAILAKGIPQDSLGGHALLNLVGGSMIVAYKIMEMKLKK